MTEAVASYFSNTCVPIASSTVGQSFFHRQIVPISGPNISVKKIRKTIFLGHVVDITLFRFPI